MKLALKAAPGGRRAAGKLWAGGRPGLPSRLFVEHVLCAAAQRTTHTQRFPFQPGRREPDSAGTISTEKEPKQGRAAETLENGYLREGLWSGKFTGVGVHCASIQEWTQHREWSWRVSRLESGRGWVLVAGDGVLRRPGSTLPLAVQLR